ncbi:AAA family ATPase [Caenimonas koreensis]|uniref:trifunctional serine/threonine-protein kinase/ATP-binding protein/sensor histidine kinase n=1 Tax=Caenimonas koreensis TaxID=367474 RepID=UPI003783B78A
MRGSTVPLPGHREESRVDVLHESATTRVVRQRDGLASIVLKEPLGVEAPRRLHHEKSILSRLASTSGVARLVAGPQPAGAVAVVDCDGVPLSQLLLAGPVACRTLLSMACPLAGTIAAMHLAGVIHCDINPSNILLSSTGEPVLIDFDLARLVDQDDDSEQPAGIVGTLAYLAPEQTGRTGRAVDQRADMYSFGATLYEMATGRPPFESNDTLQIVHDHLVREPQVPSQVNASVPAGLSAIILRLLAKTPEDRYQSAEGLLHDLQRLRVELDGPGDGLFELAQRDFPARLGAPAQTVGRDVELAVLRQALTEAGETSRRAVLIAGAAGVGKSALVNELRPEVAAAGGWFVYGKSDQYQTARMTAGAMTQALRALGRLLLAQPRQEAALQRQRIVERLGSNADLITRLLPEFELLLGSHPDVRQLDPRQAELQLHEATIDLLAAVVSHQKPLVLVVDDLQWASAQTLATFERLAGDTALRGLLLVGTYRAEELDASHPLTAVLGRLRQAAQPAREVALASLSPDAMTELAARMLRQKPESAREFADAVRELTGGNPFDTVEMINSLRRDGLLRLQEQGWSWDSEAIRRYVGRGNVVDLLAARIERLPRASRDILERMTCIGNEAAVDLLAVATGLSEDMVRHRLAAPLEDGLLVVEPAGAPDVMRFRHDRVQQAVRSAMGERHRKLLHLELARRLVQAPRREAAAALQYMECADTLVEPSEQRLVARLLYEVALKMAHMALYSQAECYLATAGVALASLGEPADIALRDAVDVQRHAALYCLGRLDESDPLYSAMLARATDPLDLVEPTCLQMRSVEMRGRAGDAMQLGLDLLRQLGVHAPAGYVDDTTAQQLDALNEWIAQDSQIDHSTRQQITDPRLLAIAKLLGRTIRSALVRFDTDAVVWSLLECKRLWSDHGPCPELVSCLGRMGGMLISLRKDYRAAYNISRHVMVVGAALGYQAQAVEARFVFSTYGGHWFEPLEHVLPPLARAYEEAQAIGDPSFACYVHLVLFTVLVEMAPTIDVTLAELDEGIALCQRTGNVHAAALHMPLRQTLRALGAQTQPVGSFDDAQFDSAAFLARMGRFPFIENAQSECRAMFALIMGDATQFSLCADRGMAHLGNLGGYYMTVYAHLFVAIARAWEVQAVPERADAPSLLAQLQACLAWLTDRATDQPHNYLHLVRFVEAEKAWAEGNLAQAAMRFDMAMVEAANRDRPWHRAVITERAGMLQLAHGLAHVGRMLLSDACDQYQSWGATLKVAQLRHAHSFLRPLAQPAHQHAERPASRSLGGSSTVSPDALDLMGVLRASQVLSSETSLDRLAFRVTEVLASLSGATKVLVLLWDDGKWWMLAPGSGESSMPVGQAGERGLLPLSVLAYVERTGQALVVDDALLDDRFARDPYFASVPLCSLLATPIASQGTTRAMLLLENRYGRAAFNAQRLDAVMLIAGQLAVSLANAQLYEGLEQRVAARTRELEQTQAQLMTTARRAGMAEIANNVLHNVGNVLNSVNVSASVMRRTVRESRAEGLARAVELMNAHQQDLPQFMGNDPRGKALLGYLNGLVDALKQEQSNMLSDLDRLARSVEHITYVVSTQQSHAGPSSVLEQVAPQELLEEALQLSEQILQRYGTHVVRNYEPMRTLALDKQRLLQILVNLIGNAAQAMESMPLADRALTLALYVVTDEEGARLYIAVQDRGEGIAQEDLQRIFAHGFTTRKDGHGFGLHSSALAAKEMGGRLTVKSEGPGRGATFTVELAMTTGAHQPPGSLVQS